MCIILDHLNINVELRYFTANFLSLSEVFPNITTESALQPLSGGPFTHDLEEGVGLTEGFFDVWFFHHKYYLHF